MRAQVIVIPGNETSELGFNRLLKSYQDTEQEFSINNFEASTPFTAESEMRDFDLTWNYPWEGETYDFATGLKKRAYVGRDPMARVACSMSHFRLWAECFETKETFLILEHDAYFIKQIPIDIILEWDYQIIGVNDPLGATRKARDFKNLSPEQKRERNERTRKSVRNSLVFRSETLQGLLGKDAWLHKTRNSPAARSGAFTPDQRWQQQLKHRQWLADNNRL